MTPARRLLGDSLWVGLDLAFTRGSMLLAMIVVARLLGADEFGALAIIQGTVTLVASFVGSPMRLAAASEVAASHRDPTQLHRTMAAMIWGSLAGAVALCILAAVSAPGIARHALGSAALADGLRTGSLLVPLEILVALTLGILNGLGEQRRLAASGALLAVLLPLVLITGAAWDGLDGAIRGLVLGGVIAVLFRTLAIAAALRHTLRPSELAIGGSDWSILKRVAGPALGITLLWAPTNWLGTVLLVNSPQGYAQMGILAAANQWFALMLFVPNVLGFASLPLLSAARQDPHGSAFQSTRQAALRSSALVAVLVAAGVAALSPVIMRAYGAGFSAGWPVLALLSAAVVPAAISTALANELTASRRVGRVVVGQAFWAVTYLATAVVLLRWGLGATALAAAMLTGSLARLAFSAWATRDGQ